MSVFFDSEIKKKININAIIYFLLIVPCLSRKICGLGILEKMY